MSQDVTSGHCPNVLNSNAYCKLCKQLSALSVFILKVQSKNYRQEDMCTVLLRAFCQAYKRRLLDKIPFHRLHFDSCGGPGHGSPVNRMYLLLNSVIILKQQIGN